ncbi:MAG TPA: hypothetical protein VF521_12795, partial [Pyrinomonadaceae bacterium]
AFQIEVTMRWQRAFISRVLLLFLHPTNHMPRSAARILENKLFRFARVSPSAYVRREHWYHRGRI